MTMRHLSLPILSLLAVLAAPAWSAAGDTLEARLEAAMASDIRTEEERERDANRQPIETLKFFRLEPNMRG
jgi:predicted methyltransferase